MKTLFQIFMFILFAPVFIFAFTFSLIINIGVMAFNANVQFVDWLLK